MNYDSMPLSNESVDLLEAMMVAPQHERDWPDVPFAPLRWLALIEHAGAGYWRLTENGVEALTFQVVRT